MPLTDEQIEALCLAYFIANPCSKAVMDLVTEMAPKGACFRYRNPFEEYVPERALCSACHRHQIPCILSWETSVRGISSPEEDQCGDALIDIRMEIERHERENK